MDLPGIIFVANYVYMHADTRDCIDLPPSSTASYNPLYYCSTACAYWCRSLIQ